MKGYNEDYIIEHTLKSLFNNQINTFPYIHVTSLKQLMVNEAKLSFDDTVAYNRLFTDLTCSSDDKVKNMINLK